MIREEFGKIKITKKRKSELEDLISKSGINPELFKNFSDMEVANQWINKAVPKILASLHPDINDGKTSEEFKRVQSAYEEIKNFEGLGPKLIWSQLNRNYSSKQRDVKEEKILVDKKSANVMYGDFQYDLRTNFANKFLSLETLNGGLKFSKTYLSEDERLVNHFRSDYYKTLKSEVDKNLVKLQSFLDQQDYVEVKNLCDDIIKNIDDTFSWKFNIDDYSQKKVFNVYNKLADDFDIWKKGNQSLNYDSKREIVMIKNDLTIENLSNNGFSNKEDFLIGTVYYPSLNQRLNEVSTIDSKLEGNSLNQDKIILNQDLAREINFQELLCPEALVGNTFVVYSPSSKGIFVDGKIVSKPLDQQDFYDLINE